MARILYAWELGDDFGHINGFLPLARQLRARGHEISIAAKNLSRVEAVLGSEDDFRLLQAPLWLNPPAGLPEPQVSFADILIRFGYFETKGLRGQVKAWLSLYDFIKPDLVIADHAPTALLTAHMRGITRATYGTGFQVPPRTTPLPLMRPWMQPPPQRMQYPDRTALATINSVLPEFGVEPLTALHELFDVQENFLMSLQELDHYAGRQDAHYWGPMLSAGAGPQPAWPPFPGKKLFAYVKARYKYFDLFMKTLKQLPVTSLVYASGITPAQIKQYECDRVYISQQPVNMDYATAHCDMAVCHAGMGTVTAMLLAGRPLLLLPMHLEQTLTSRNVANMRCGVAFVSDKETPNFPFLFQHLINDQSLTANARIFADKYQGYDSAGLLDRLVARCEELAGTRQVLETA